MARDAAAKPPLFRKENTTAHRPNRHAGGDFSSDRHSKAAVRSDAMRAPMRGQFQGRDYTPLFRFLLSRVGCRWADVHSEAVARLDRQEPIHWMVALHPEEERAIVRVGESSFFSGLRVDEQGLLQRVDPALSAASFAPTCACCTHTFNGKPFERKYSGTPGVPPDQA